MSAKDILIVVGALGFMALAVALLTVWTKWRTSALKAAGKRAGLRPLDKGMSTFLPLVPLVDRPGRTCLLFLHGVLDGYDATFFDIYCMFGKSWDYQSTLLLRNPAMSVPRFQLQTPQWSQAAQRTCGDRLTIPGREKEMGSLRLSADDPEWARRVFSHASAEFYAAVKSGLWTVEGVQHSLVIYRWGERVAPRKLERYLQDARDLAARVFALCA